MIQKQTEEGRAFCRTIQNQNIKSTMQKEGFNQLLPQFLRPEPGAVGAIPGGFKPLDPIMNHPIYAIQSKAPFERIVIFLHGGAYLMAPMDEHFSFCAAMAEQLKAKVIFPIYPKSPQYGVEDCFDFLDQLYDQISEENPTLPMIFMGDSAGGGLALAYTETLIKQKKSPRPSARVLISPWVDVGMTNRAIWSMKDDDIFLDYYGLSLAGQLWAGDHDPRDERISPLYGSLDGGIPTLIFAGSKEILKPDIQKTARKLKKQGCPVTLVIGQGLFHVYPVYDFDMAFQARNMMCDFIRSTESDG